MGAGNSLAQVEVRNIPADRGQRSIQERGKIQRADRATAGKFGQNPFMSFGADHRRLLSGVVLCPKAAATIAP